MANLCKTLRSLRLISSSSSFSRSCCLQRSVHGVTFGRYLSSSSSSSSAAVLLCRALSEGKRGFSSESMATEPSDSASSEYPLPTPPPGDFDDFPAADADYDDDMVPEDDEPPPDPDAGALFSPDEEE